MVVQGIEIDASKAVLDRPRQFPLVYLLELGGVVNQNVIAKEIKEFPIGLKADIGELALLSLGPRNTPGDFVLLQIV